MEIVLEKVHSASNTRLKDETSLWCSFETVILVQKGLNMTWYCLPKIRPLAV